MPIILQPWPAFSPSPINKVDGYEHTQSGLTVSFVYWDQFTGKVLNQTLNSGNGALEVWSDDNYNNEQYSYPAVEQGNSARYQRTTPATLSGCSYIYVARKHVDGTIANDVKLGSVIVDTPLLVKNLNSPVNRVATEVMSSLIEGNVTFQQAVRAIAAATAGTEVSIDNDHIGYQSLDGSTIRITADVSGAFRVVSATNL